MSHTRTELIVAADLDSLADAQALVDTLGDTVSWFKVGKQLFTRTGPAAVELFKQAGKKVFLDMKFHDIPNTVAGAVRSAASIGADMINVHASGGPAMLEAAAEAAANDDVLLIGVTVLTSLDAVELAAVGLECEPRDQVVRLAKLAKQGGLDGVVCSALEIGAIQEACGPEFQLVVPGIRPAGADRGDQKRVMTPGEAAAAGAQFIVVGRPITKAADPAAAARAVQAELA